MVLKCVEGSGAFGIASVIEHALPAGECNLRVLFVCDILVVDQAACKPEFAVGGLVDLEIGIIAFRVPLLVAAVGFFPDAVLVGQLEQQRVSHGGPDKALGIGVHGPYRPAERLPVGAGNDGAVPDRSVMPDLIGHLFHYRDPFRRPHPQAVRRVHGQGVHPAVLLPASETHPVKTGQAIPGPHPEDAIGILCNGIDRIGRQTIRRVVVHKPRPRQ